MMNWKTYLSLICFGLFLTHSVIGQNNGTLTLHKNKLTGKCENKFYTGFEIELDSTYSEIDSTILFSQLPRVGTINFKNKLDINTEFTLTERAGFPQIMFRFRDTYLTFDNLKFEKKSIAFIVDHDPKVPVTEDDLKIIELAKTLLMNEANWNKNDDRNCEDDLANNSYSIYCALRIASLEIEERYNNRNAVLQKLRHLIAEKYPAKKWNHRLMDFNNMADTKHEDMMNIIDEIKESFMLELNSGKRN